jgi:predicted ATP-grasp superfamily ATP-dependent carboligase
LFEAGATYVDIPDLLASERLLTVIRGLLETDLDTTDLRREGVRHLREVESALRERDHPLPEMGSSTDETRQWSEQF